MTAAAHRSLSFLTKEASGGVLLQTIGGFADFTSIAQAIFAARFYSGKIACK